MILFNSIEIEGYHTALLADAPQLAATRRPFFGLDGTSEVVGGRQGRMITCQLWLTSSGWTNVKQLLARLRDLDNAVGGNHDLEERDHQTSPGIPQKFPECTFQGFQRLPLPGQDMAGPLKDLAGTLHVYQAENFAKNGGAWFQFGQAVWYQPIPKLNIPVDS